MDIKKMQLLLMERGIRVADNDEIFTLLAFNGIMLEESEKKQAQIFSELAGRVEHAKTSLIASINTMADMDKKLSQSKADLLSTIEATKSVQKDHIADLLAASMKQMEAVSAEKLDAFTKCALETSQAEVTSIVKEAEEVKKAILQSVASESIKIVRERVALEDSSLTEASNAYKKLTSEFEGAMVKRHKDALESVKRFDEALQNSIKEHADVGWFWRIAGMTLAAAIGTVFAGFLMAKSIIPMPGQSLTEQQVHQQSIGANLEGKFNQFTPKEQARINAVLTSQ